MSNPFNLTLEDVEFLEKRLVDLFERLKISAERLTLAQQHIDKLLADPRINVLALENVYAQEFGFAAENYELYERLLTTLNQIYLFDDSRLTARRIERDSKKYLLVELMDR
jgi:hypothetical protein